MQVYFTTGMPQRQRWDRFAVSLATHVIGIMLLTRFAVWTPLEFHKLDTQQSVTLVAPLPYRPSSHVQPPPPPKLPALADLRTPAIIPLAKPKREPTPVQKPPLPPGSLKTPLPAPKAVEPRQAPHVQATSFGGGSSAVPTVKAPARAVQTGGFGDANGVPGEGSKDAKLTIASLGSFDLPGGRGYGNGSGGMHGIRGTVASAGFGNGIAGPGQGNGRGPGGSVAQGGFADATIAAVSTPKSRAEHTPVVTPVEIIAKPKPVYTAEARQLHLQGEVLLDVVFGASGQLRVMRVVKGLGHGLDEAALRAAQQIRFRPGRRDGAAYDSTAVVHIIFELAE